MRTLKVVCTKNALLTVQRSGRWKKRTVPGDRREVSPTLKVSNH